MFEQAFKNIDDVLWKEAGYIRAGVGELAPDNLSPLLKLKYNNVLTDAVADLGQPEEFGQVFVGFQKYLYPPQIAA